MNRPLFASWLIASVAVSVASTSWEDVANQSPGELLTLARAAIGGEPKLASVKSIRLGGDLRVLNQAYGRHPDAREEHLSKKLEIQALWPEFYLRTRTTVLPDGREMSPIKTGFAAGTNLGGTVGANVDRLDFARWMLLFLLRTDTAVPLKLRPTLNQHGELQFDGPHNLHCAIALDPTTHVPSGLRMPVKRPEPDGFPGSETIREIIFSVVSAREVDGIRLPDHVVVKDVADPQRILEQYRFRNIDINPPLTPGDFKR